MFHPLRALARFLCSLDDEFDVFNDKDPTRSRYDEPPLVIRPVPLSRWHPPL